jgi:hypothetical protein
LSRNALALCERGAKRHAEFDRLRGLSTGFMRERMANFILSIATFAAILLLFGAWKLWKRDGAVQKMWLMVAAALVIFANIAIWVVPDDKGQTLINPNR